MDSLWTRQTNDIKSKNENRQSSYRLIHWDVIVVGGGMAGILTAYYLTKAGKSVLVIDSARIASGQTAGTTAKITSQHDIKYSKLIKTVGRKKALMYANANQWAISEYERLIRKENISCDFERADAYLYSLNNNIPLKDEARAAESLGIDAYFAEKNDLPFDTKGAVCFRNQAMFSPLKFIKHIASHLNIKENTRVLKVRGRSVYASDGRYTADNVVIATNYPVINFPGFYFMRQHCEKSYVIAVKTDSEINGMYKGTEKESLSLRRSGEYVLVGGYSHRTGGGECSCVYEKLEEAANKYFPGCEICMKWSAQDCMPHDGIPFIGKYSVFMKSVYVATGFQKWGMTSSMVAANIICDSILGRNNPYSKVFSPQRLNIRAGLIPFSVDIYENLTNFFGGLTDKPHRCPHLGCKLVYNNNTHTWDCPCHGSSFDGSGKLLNGPSKKNMKIYGKKRRRKLK